MLDTNSILGEGDYPWQKMWAFLLHEMCVSTKLSPGKQLSVANMEQHAWVDELDGKRPQPNM